VCAAWSEVHQVFISQKLKKESRPFGPTMVLPTVYSSPIYTYTLHGSDRYNIVNNLEYYFPAQNSKSYYVMQKLRRKLYCFQLFMDFCNSKNTWMVKYISKSKNVIFGFLSGMLIFQQHTFFYCESVVCGSRDNGRCTMHFLDRDFCTFAVGSNCSFVKLNEF
jgi:hypothetical protein